MILTILCFVDIIILLIFDIHVSVSLPLLFSRFSYRSKHSYVVFKGRMHLFGMFN